MNAMTQAEPVVKGAALLGFYRYIKDRPRGEELLAEVVADMPEQSTRLCGKKVIAVGEYPYSVFVDFLVSIDRVLGSGDLRGCYELGDYAGTRDVAAFLDMAKKEVTPGDLVWAANVLWRNYHLNSGHMEVENPEPGYTIIKIIDFPQMHPAHCRLMEGYFSGSLKRAGYEWIESIKETKCPSRGDEHHRFEGKWRKAS